MKFTDIQIEFLLTKMSINDIEEFNSFVSCKPIITCSALKKNGSPCKIKVKQNGMCTIHKNIYEHELSKKVCKKACIFPVKLIVADSKWAEFYDSTYDIDIAKFMNNNNNKIVGDLSKIKRGDLIFIEKINNIKVDKYRNNGKFIWDGEKFMELEYEYDKYGSIRKDFLTFDEFPLRYWYEAIDHNCISMVSPNRLKYLKKDKNEFDTDFYIYELTGNDKTYKVGCETKLDLDKIDVVPMEETDDEYSIFDFLIREYLC